MIPALRDLHWLPVTARIKYKLCLLVHKATVGRFSLAEVERSLSYSAVEMSPAGKISSIWWQ